MVLSAVAAVGWFVVSSAYGWVAVRTMGAGDVLSGVGQLFVGLAAAVAAFASWLNGRKAKDNSAEAVKSLGPANGSTVHELLKEIKGFEEYQHRRNHDVLNELTRLNASTPLVAEVAERLLAKLKET